MKRTILVSLWLFLVLTILGANGSAETVRAGYTSKTIFYLPFFAAQKKGFYEAGGLQVQLIQMGSSSIHLQALIAGEIHFANISPDGPILYNEKGGNLKVIAGVDNAAPYVLIGGKNHKWMGDRR